MRVLQAGQLVLARESHRGLLAADGESTIEGHAVTAEGNGQRVAAADQRVDGVELPARVVDDVRGPVGEVSRTRSSHFI